MQCRDVRRTPRLLENKAEELHIFDRAGDNTIGRVLKKRSSFISDSGGSSRSKRTART